MYKLSASFVREPARHHHHQSLIINIIRQSEDPRSRQIRQESIKITDDWGFNASENLELLDKFCIKIFWQGPNRYPKLFPM
jgi:hypothetical protein